MTIAAGLAMPALAARAADEIRVVSVKSGETLAHLLQRAGASAADTQEAVNALVRVWNPRDLKAGQEITLDFGPQRLEGVRFAAGLDREVKATRTLEGSFAAASQRRDAARVPHLAAGVIRTSLYDAAVDAGVPLAVLTDMVRAFSYDVDFQREVQPGDRFEVLFEHITDRKGRIIGNGDLIYASMTLSGTALRIYRYTADGASAADFFNAQGQSVKKALLKTPIDGARLTSSFGVRFHPILGYSAMHRGVDFGAATGTPIVAAGDGVVEKAGYNGGYGNYVLIRHGGTYSTAYAHMSRVAVRAGAHVYQGQVIGYVGATGLATGPHLHYEVLMANRQVNPLSIKMEPGRKLGPAEMQPFRAVADEIDRQLLSLRQDSFVASAAGARPN